MRHRGLQAVGLNPPDVFGAQAGENVAIRQRNTTRRVARR